MSLDVNKIIMESINETLDDEKKEPEAIQEGDEKKVEKTPEKKVEESSEELSEDTLNPLDIAIAPAIAAGLGALSLRNKIRSVT